MRIIFDMLDEEVKEQIVEQFGETLCLEEDATLFFNEHLDKTDWFIFCERELSDVDLSTCELKDLDSHRKLAEAWLEKEYEQWNKYQMCCNYYSCPCH